MDLGLINLSSDIIKWNTPILDPLVRTKHQNVTFVVKVTSEKFSFVGDRLD